MANAKNVAVDSWRLRAFHLRVVVAVSLVTSVIVGVSSWLLWLAERHAAGSNIRGYGDSVWWAMETITTVGYGDHHPTTVPGRWIASALMVIGVALVGVITATVVTWFFSELDVLRDVRKIEAEEERTEASLAEILRELARLNERLDRLESSRRER
ncbi:voltage-gated potassium channel Kch [Marmoricola sp. URHA0025 HA25]